MDMYAKMKELLQRVEDLELKIDEHIGPLPEEPEEPELLKPADKAKSAK